MKRFLVAALLSASVPAAFADTPPAPGAKAVTGPGTTVVKAANEAIAGHLKLKVKVGSPEEKALAAKVTSSLRGFLDIDQLGVRAMDEEWKKVKKAQQDEFLTLLRALIEDNYIRGLRSNLDYKVEYTGESTDPKGNTVVTTVVNAKRKGRPFTISVDYVLVKQGDTLRAFDIKTDGVSLVENYRSMFRKIIAKDGIDGLLNKMRKKKDKELTAG